MMMYEIPEDWRILPGTKQEYAATPAGDIVRLPRRVSLVRQGKDVVRQYPVKVLKQTNRRGYRTVGLTIDGTLTTQSVHRLVCLAFHGSPPSLDKGWVLHNDGNPANNRPENLRWGSAQDNSDDATRHATHRITCGRGIHSWNVNPLTPNPSRSRCTSCEADERRKRWDEQMRAFDAALRDPEVLKAMRSAYQGALLAS